MGTVNHLIKNLGNNLRIWIHLRVSINIGRYLVKEKQNWIKREPIYRKSLFRLCKNRTRQEKQEEAKSKTRQAQPKQENCSNQLDQGCQARARITVSQTKTKEEQDKQEKEHHISFCCILTQVVANIESHVHGAPFCQEIKSERELVGFFKARLQCDCLDRYSEELKLKHDKKQASMKKSKSTSSLNSSK